MALAGLGRAGLARTVWFWLGRAAPTHMKNRTKKETRREYVKSKIMWDTGQGWACQGSLVLAGLTRAAATPMKNRTKKETIRKYVKNKIMLDWPRPNLDKAGLARGIWGLTSPPSPPPLNNQRGKRKEQKQQKYGMPKAGLAKAGLARTIWV